VFHDCHCDRWWYAPGDEWDLEWYFRGCPAYQRSLADQAALDSLRFELDGRLYHRVTAAFWDHGEYLTAPDPWELLLANGVRLIATELIEDVEAALTAWQEDYQMTPEQLAFARSVFERKMARPPAVLELSPADVEFLQSTFEDPKAMYDELDRLSPGDKSAQEGPKWWDSIDSAAEAQKAMKLCREGFAELGIQMPDGSPA
jgi:hypothetical protein